MTLQPDLLEVVRRTAVDLADAERQVLVARGEHYTAIRRLHLAGAPLREIAGALAMSHQRVQQIVQASGGSWWRRAWRTRNRPRGAACTWCGRPPSEVGKLVAGPHVFICDRCLGEAEQALVGGVPSARAGRVARGGDRARCSFCRRRPTESRAIVAGPTGGICTDCLRVCREMMGEGAKAGSLEGGKESPGR